MKEVLEGCRILKPKKDLNIYVRRLIQLLSERRIYEDGWSCPTDPLKMRYTLIKDGYLEEV